MNATDAKIVALVVAYISVIAAIAYSQLKSDYPTDIVDFQNHIEDRGTLSADGLPHPGMPGLTSFRMEVDGCLLRIEKTLDEQKACANTAISDRQWLYRTEFQLSRQLNIRLSDDDFRGVSRFFISVAPKFRNDPNLTPFVTSGIQCDGRNAEAYKSNSVTSFALPMNVAKGLDDAIRQYIKEFC